ncbi:MAG: lasso peptide biosynthesis B2 protein, partial [Caldilineaceae bacterium]|nr:lasso peptide biosynthesis B2 protein [Caldilineaceae bacterium]
FLFSITMLPITALGLRLFHFNRWYAWLKQLARHAPPATADTTAAIIRCTIRSLALAVRHGLYEGNCLSRSLTLWWLLRRQGIAADLRIGVRRHQGVLEAHAWVEYLGMPLNEQTQVHEQYAAFAAAI